jgi:hypothetical protein
MHYCPYPPFVCWLPAIGKGCTGASSTLVNMKTLNFTLTSRVLGGAVFADKDTFSGIRSDFGVIRCSF